MIEKYYSRGKLLLTGEYLVLKGAKSLAVPVNLGQSLEIKPQKTPVLNWQTFEQNKSIFTAQFNINDFSALSSSNNTKAQYISLLLKALKKLKPKFLHNSKGYVVIARVEFNMQWGLGTSSTLINNLAQWYGVNPFELNGLVSKGSGYDIACAAANGPISYQIINEQPVVNKVEFSPPFINNLTLVYLNKKMATENNVKLFLQQNSVTNDSLKQMSTLTQNFINCKKLDTFLKLMNEHEILISSMLEELPVKQQLFSDFEGAVKSLGVWGGDFVLAASHNNFEKQCQYFNNKGYTTVIPLKNLMV